MSIDTQHERLIRLSDVPALKFMPREKNGKKIHVATIYRWALGGTGGVKLETMKVGGTLCTSVAALQRFFDKLSGASEMVPPGHDWSPKRGREIEAATRKLDAML